MPLMKKLKPLKHGEGGKTDTGKMSGHSRPVDPGWIGMT